MSESCVRCGSPGPFYASQPYGTYCIPCRKAISQARHAHHRDAINAALRAKRLRRLLVIPVEQRSRRQQRRLLQAACPPGKKVCAWCWLAKWPGAYRRVPMRHDGRDYYCRACRRIWDRSRTHAGRAAHTKED